MLLAAGLAGDALAEADAALRDIEQVRGRSTKKAELLLMAANCALAAAQPQTALDWAQAAHRLFRSQRSAWWQAHAALVLVQARYAVGPASAALLREANRAAARLEALGSSDAAQAHLLAGRVALDLGRRADADRHLSAAARSRRRGPALSRASGWLGEALRAEAAGRPAPDARRLPPRARRPGRVPAHPGRLGAAGPGHRARRRTGRARPAPCRAGRPPAAAAGLERALAGHRAGRSRRYGPSADAELNASLAALREVTRQLEKARRRGRPSAALQREQQRLERAVRASALRARGAHRGTRAACQRRPTCSTSSARPS